MEPGHKSRGFGRQKADLTCIWSGRWPGGSAAGKWTHALLGLILTCLSSTGTNSALWHHRSTLHTPLLKNQEVLKWKTFIPKARRNPLVNFLLFLLVDGKRDKTTKTKQQKTISWNLKQMLNQDEIKKNTSHLWSFYLYIIPACQHQTFNVSILQRHRRKEKRRDAKASHCHQTIKRSAASLNSLQLSSAGTRHSHYNKQLS